MGRHGGPAVCRLVSWEIPLPIAQSSRLLAAGLAAAGLVLSASAVALPAQAHTTGIHDNCTKLNKKYPHGVGRRNARDRGGDVTNFKRSNRIYKKAVRHNSDLDRDKDKIACEKA